jgi:hypothetical protein
MLRRRAAALLLALVVSPRPALAQLRTVVLLGSPSPRLEQSLQTGLRARRLLLVSPPSLGPAEPTGTADPDVIAVRDTERALERARQLYYEVQLVRAVELLDEQLRGAAPILARARRFDLLAALHLWRTVCLLKRGDAELARAAAASAILLGQGPIDETRYAPAVVETFASVRQALGAAPRARLSLVLSPPSAQVLLDGRPPSAPLPPGDHWLVAESPGYISTARLVRLEAGRTTSLRLTLYPADRALLRRQLQSLASHGELDPQNPAIALALCRWCEAGEALLVREAHSDLALARIECDRGQVKARFRGRAAPELEGAVGRGLSQLWGPLAQPAPRAPPRPAPFYKRWWFWTIVGGAVAGATTVGVVVGTRGSGTYTLRAQH